ncbi:MAG: efflux RND transporter periplasmic adaptor subunit [Thiobacillus sp.]|jgi:Cu(I)/Ag(I) efflux system membrane fusion protein|uniref:efflux RND transporter periplasmic adaptor subunit n=1 Tax=Thiobacillus sp. TaxID=924 RepID=UPI002895E89F|nr:efflux RND transporter periplasmic adaptor subunit [Thiobacillus sp.]MDT3706187.1 efflux RND transporter periplasmic adaptor subunit [Thiobacillus sp.]
MKGPSRVIGIITAVALAAGGGYWLGMRGEPAAQTPANAGAKPERKLLYYRNPMGLADTSPVPKKDPMGMDYIAVYEGGEEGDTEGAANQITISTEKIQKLGVRTEAASLRALDRTVRAAGRVEPDERRIHAIAPRFEGYIERLYVNVSGQAVSKGQPLFEVYSPELVSAQREYALAVQGVEAMKEAGSEAQSAMRQLAESSLMRLRNWDISEAQVKALAKSGETKRTLTFRSPVSGIVTEKKAVQGMRFMPGESLFQVTDLASVWIVADVFEQDIGLVKTGAQARVTINAYPDKVFEGRITYVYPSLEAATRTVPVRVELANPGYLLKPAMFAQVELPVGGKAAVLAIPDSAVIDSGMRRIVLVQLERGRFAPREVRLGARSNGYVEVLEGVAAGEPVVVAANFLIDAESNLRAAIGGLGGGSTPQTDTVPLVKPSAAGHQAEGTVDGVDAGAGTVSINHGPVKTLQWPAMTMEFKLANAALLKGLKPGAAVAFEFVERQPGEWVITGIKPLAGPSAPVPVNPHAGH